MKALTRFEELLEGVVEGSFRRLFRGRIEPVDLARRLGRAMDDNRRVTWERPLVPNSYHITLAEDDFAQVHSYVESLRRELARFAADRAEERGYGLPGPAAVTIAADPTLASGSFQVHATMVDGPAANQQARDLPPGSPPDDSPTVPPEGPGDFGQTRPMRPLEMPLGPAGYQPLSLVSQIGDRRTTWPISGARVTVGRGLDNDVVLEDASVSRHHAEIVRDGGRTEIRDLSSKNGTWVNARRITVCPIHPGDEVAFGAVQMEVARRQPE